MLIGAQQIVKILFYFKIQIILYQNINIRDFTY